MDLDLEQLSPSQVYHTVIQTLVPRPIAWVLSENENRSYNLAPFSYFNAVASQPPLLMISVGKKADGSFKDTRVNIEARKHFVVHIPAVPQVQQVNDSSVTLPAEQSEVEHLQLETVNFGSFSLPRLAECPVAYACSLYELKEIGQTPMSLLIGRIQHIHIDDKIIDAGKSGRIKINAQKLNPLARLGGEDFATLGEFLSVPRPRLKP